MKKEHVRIVNIHPSDGYYHKAHVWQGKTGMFFPEPNSRKKKYREGWFVFDDTPASNLKRVYFWAVMLKPVFKFNINDPVEWEI